MSAPPRLRDLARPVAGAIGADGRPCVVIWATAELLHGTVTER